MPVFLELPQMFDISEMDVIWENPSPTSSFTSTVDIAFNWASYDHVYVELKYANDSTYQTLLYEIQNDLTYAGKTKTMTYSRVEPNSAGDITIAYRNYQINTSGLKIINVGGYVNTNTSGKSTSNVFCIPVKVYGANNDTISLDKTLLWENPNPRQAMGNTTITVPNILEYDYIMFETYVAPNSATIPNLVYQTICRVEDIQTKVGQYYGRPLTLSCVYDNAGSWTTYQRLIVWNSMTACNFQSCVQFGTQSVFNGLNVPLRIYGVKRYIKRDGYQKDVLWTNPSSSSSYGSNELSIDFSGYDYLMVKFKVSTSNSREFTSIGKISELYTSDTPRPKLSGAYYSSSGTTYHREWGITGAGKFEFYQCYGGSSASNSNVIPLEIYGIK